jgi:hypothetical protein
MTKHAPNVVSLKAGFQSHFNYKVSVRRVRGADNEYIVSVPEFSASAADRLLLVKIGAWLESRRYFLCHDYGRVGVLSSPDGWTYWHEGASLRVRYYLE